MGVGTSIDDCYTNIDQNDPRHNYGPSSQQHLLGTDEIEDENNPNNNHGEYTNHGHQYHQGQYQGGYGPNPPQHTHPNHPNNTVISRHGQNNFHYSPDGAVGQIPNGAHSPHSHIYPLNGPNPHHHHPHVNGYSPNPLGPPQNGYPPDDYIVNDIKDRIFLMDR